MANQKHTNATLPTSIPYIPQHIPGASPTRANLIKLYRIAPDGTWESMRRSDFFKLAKTVSYPCAHICPDIESGRVYFVDAPTPEQQNLHITLCRELEKLKKRSQRTARCIYFGTLQCEGWKVDAEGNRRCDTCQHSTLRRQTSLDVPVTDDDGNEDPLAMYLPSTEATPEETLITKAERQELLRLLAALPDEDRRLVVASVQDGMDFGKLAEMFGLSNRNYASKKTGRILERLRKEAQKFNH